MRHFEKPIGQRVFKSVAQKGNVVELAFGCAGDQRCLTRIKCKSAREASALAEQWATFALLGGLSEFSIDDFIPGRVSSLEPLQGGRVRTDDNRDIFISNELVEAQSLKQGMRVLVGEIGKSKRNKKEFMFKSPWRAGAVRRFPKALKSSIKPKSLNAATKSKVKKQIGKRLLGADNHEGNKKQKFQLGDLVLGYYGGIYRIIKFEQESDMNHCHCDLVLDRHLDIARPQPTDMFASKFGEPLPQDILGLLKGAGLTVK